MKSKILKIVTCLSASVALAHGQLVVEEDFESYSEGDFLDGSSSGNGQWTSAWSIDNSQRLKVTSNSQNFGRSAPGLGSVIGRTRCLEVTTSFGSSSAVRSYSSIDVPFYISFLLSIENAGTGGGFLDVMLIENGNQDVVVRVVPDIEREAGAYYFNGTQGSIYSLPTQEPGKAFLVVLRLQNPRMSASAAIRVNPTAESTYSKSYAGSGNTNDYNAIGIRAGRSTSSGSDSVFRIDQVRIGLTRPDVLPNAPAGSNVANPAIEMIPRVVFYSESGKIYYIQRSLNLHDWFNVTTVNGNGTLKSWVDQTGPVSAFYRVISSP
jgi:hypothetical protein